jgi:hypothetical protein
LQSSTPGILLGNFMDRLIAAVLVLAGSAAPAFAGDVIVVVPEPATLTLFGLGVGGAYLAKRFIGRK